MNIAEILKDAPEGTKLYSPIFGDVVFKGIDVTDHVHPILIVVSENLNIRFTKEGYYYSCYEGSECVLFPSSEQRDWSKFHIYKPGTFLAIKEDGRAFILKGYHSKGYPMAFVGINSINSITAIPNSTNYWTTGECRLATPSEITILMGKLLEAGYEWNEETLELTRKMVKEESNMCQKLEELEEALKGKCIESFKKSCPCWSRFEKDRKCDECAYLKDFVDNMEEV